MAEFIMELRLRLPDGLPLATRADIIGNIRAAAGGSARHAGGDLVSDKLRGLSVEERHGPYGIDVL